MDVVWDLWPVMLSSWLVAPTGFAAAALEEGRYGLIAVYATNMADQIAAKSRL